MGKKVLKKIRGFRLFRILKKMVLWYLDLINPKRIIKYYISDVKKNKVLYALASLVLVLIFSTKVGLMDFPTGTLFGTTVYGMVCGGAVSPIDSSFIDFAELVYNSIVPVGTALVVMFWLFELVGLTVRDNFSTEILAMHMIKLIFGVALIGNGPAIMRSFVNLENALTNSMNTGILAGMGAQATIDVINLGNIAGPINPNNPAPVNNALKALVVKEAVIKLVDILRVGPVLSVMLIIGVISMIVLKLQCISRSIKLALYFAFAPIGLADLAGNEHSSSIRFLKNVLAIVLQGAILVGINYFAAYIVLHVGDYRMDSAAFHGTIWDLAKNASFSIWGIIPAIAVGCAAIGMYSKSEEIAKTILGV